MIKLLNFNFSASNSVPVSWLGIGFQVILKKKRSKRKSHTPPLTINSYEGIYEGIFGAKQLNTCDI